MWRPRLPTLASGGHTIPPSRWFDAGKRSHSRTRLNKRRSRLFMQRDTGGSIELYPHILLRQQRMQKYEHLSHQPDRSNCEVLQNAVKLRSGRKIRLTLGNSLQVELPRYLVVG